MAKVNMSIDVYYRKLMIAYLSSKQHYNWKKMQVIWNKVFRWQIWQLVWLSKNQFRYIVRVKVKEFYVILN